MKTKLTLTVNEQTVKKAKNYVEKTSESLSSVVEEFLESLYAKKSKHSVVEASKGILKKKSSSLSYKDIRKEYYKEKHGV
jgi:Family of unknown function (DUF6364)